MLISLLSILRMIIKVLLSIRDFQKEKIGRLRRKQRGMLILLILGNDRRMLITLIPALKGWVSRKLLLFLLMFFRLLERSLSTRIRKGELFIQNLINLYSINSWKNHSSIAIGLSIECSTRLERHLRSNREWHSQGVWRRAAWFNG